MKYYFEYNFLIRVKMPYMFMKHVALLYQKSIFIFFGSGHYKII
jgi:hypothetical protein